jgi:hypothetical protein
VNEEALAHWGVVAPKTNKQKTVFKKAIPTQDVTNPVSLPLLYVMYYVPFFPCTM